MESLIEARRFPCLCFECRFFGSCGIRCIVLYFPFPCNEGLCYAKRMEATTRRRIFRRIAQAAVVGGLALVRRPSVVRGDTPDTIHAPAGEEEAATDVRQSTPADLLFARCSEGEKMFAEEMVRGQMRYYEKTNPLLGRRIEEVRRWMPLVAEVAETLHWGNLEAVTLLPALIFVESRGDPRALNRSTSASGLCQLLPRTAEEVGAKLGLATPIDLFNPKTNITIAIGYLDRLLRLFPDPGLAFWAYHMGEGSVTVAIREYVRMVLNVSQEKVDSILRDATRPGTSRLVEEYDLNFVKLVSNERVRRRLEQEGRFRDSTDLYVPRIAAASALIAGI